MIIIHRLVLVTFVATAALNLGATSLPDLLDEASRNNPDIAAAMRGWRAAAQVPSQVSAMPDPQLTVQHVAVGSPRPFAGYSNSDFAYIGFGISQDLPYPGKLSLRAESAERDVALSREKYEAARRNVFEQVKASYFQLAYIQKTLGVLEHDQTVLDQIEKIAEAHYRLGQGNQQDVLRAQLQKTKILNDLAHHHELMDSLQAQMTRLLNRPPGAADVEAEDLTETPLTYTSEELLAKVRTENPDVTGGQEMVRKQSLQVELARKDRYPDFNVQYQWEHTGEQSRDYYMLTFSARLPIYRKRKLDPELAQAVEELDQSRRQYESHVQQTYFEVRDQYISAETASQMLKIYREGLIPQALATLRSGLSAYEAGNQDFQSVLSSFLDVLNFDEEYWKTLADHETALARIEQLTGVAIHSGDNHAPL
jgi:cobalt-zinc-cadmium efflux system outer membrane protein